MVCANYFVTDMETLNNPLVSVLVSCFNVERFIESFFDNIRKQTYTNFELIIVNDGSNDKTLQLIRSYSNIIDNIIILSHNQNLGLGAGRNTGLERASGKYVYFCDVDDYIKPNLIKECVAQMENSNTDFLIFGFDVKYPDSHICDETICFKEIQLRSPKEIRDNYVETLLLSKHGNGFVWNKFYRRSFLVTNGLRFGTQKIQQDEVFNIKTVLAASSIKLFSMVLYSYNIFAVGNNRSRYIPERFEIFIDVRKHFDNLFKVWGLQNDKTNMYLNLRFWGNIMNCLQYDLTHKDCKLTYLRKRKRFKQIISHPYSLESRSFLLKNKRLIGFRTKMYLWSFRCYELYRLTDGILTLSRNVYKAIGK